MAARKPKAPSVHITPAEAHDILQFLNRVATQGLIEAQRLTQLAVKVHTIRGEWRPNQEKPSGEDSSATD